MSPITKYLTAYAIAAVLPGIAAAQTVGVASWYGGRHDGLRTSSGEVFDQEGLTAASRSIPLGSRVRVTMHETGQSVVVTVNDRMGGRSAIIDLSKGAAREIGLLGRGRGMVTIASESDEPLEVAEASEDETSDIQGGSVHRRHGRRAMRASAGAARHGAHVMLAKHTSRHRSAPIRAT